jgi:GT2 family glycosyltransferase
MQKALYMKSLPSENGAEGGGLRLSVVIPTYGREEILLDTVRMLGELAQPPHEIILADQTRVHEPGVQSALQLLAERGEIRWLRLECPSIPGAMNRGLLAARSDIVLFLDDDIIPGEELIAAHLRAHEEPGVTVVAGRVLQPWDRDDVSPPEDGRFRFSGLRREWIEDFMGGNFSVKRDSALSIGGFDENFVQVAHWFEKEFADRLKLRNIPILFVPQACIRHLKAQGGGIRAYGQWRKTVRPGYAVGSYYYLLRSPRVRHRLATILLRPLKVIRTRHHLTHPWWIPPTLLAELLAFFWAVRLTLQGPRLIGRGGGDAP